MKKLMLVFGLFFLVAHSIFGQRNSYEKDVWARLGQEFDAIYFDYIHDKLLVRKADKYGVCSDTGAFFLPILYDDIFLHKDWAIAKKNGQYGVITYHNQVIIPFEYDYILPNIWGFEVRKRFKRGILAANGKIIVPVAYDRILRNARDNYFAVKNDGAWGAVDSNGREVLPPIYQRHYQYQHFFITTIGDIKPKHGLFDRTGKEVLPIKYDFLQGYSDEKQQPVFVFKDSTRVGLYQIDKPIQYFDYEDIDPIHGTPFMKVYKDKTLDIINYKSGETQQEEAYKKSIKPEPFSRIDTNIFIVMSKDSLHGLVDKKGRTLLPTRYKYILPTGAKNIVLAGIAGQKDTILINYRHKKQVLPPNYTFFYFCSQNIFVAKDSSQQYVLMNTNGELLLPYTYQEIHGKLTTTMFFYKTDNNIDYQTRWEWHKLLFLPWKWRGYKEWTTDIDSTIWLPDIYRPNSSTLRQTPSMTILADGRKVLTYSDGKKSPIYENIQTRNYYELLVKTETGWGRQNHDGMQIIPPIYDTLTAIYFVPWGVKMSELAEQGLWNYIEPPHFYVAQKADKYGLINAENGAIVFPFEFQSLEAVVDKIKKMENNERFGIIMHRL